MKLVYKLLMGYLAIVLLAGTMDYISLGSFHKIERTFDSVSKGSIPDIHALENLRLATLKVSRRVTDFGPQHQNGKDSKKVTDKIRETRSSAATPEGDDHSSIDKAQELAASVEDLKTNLQLYQQLVAEEGNDVGEVSAVAALTSISHRFLENGEKLRNYKENEMAEASFRNTLKQFETDERELLHTIGDSLAHESAELDEDNRNVRNTISQATRITLVSAVFTFLLAILIGLVISRSISRRISELNDASIKISKGNLDTHVTVRSKDEVGQLAASFNKMTDELSRSSKALHTEVAERKQAQDALEESEERFRQIAENVREVFWMFDSLTQRMLYISPAYEDIWGHSCESVYNSTDSVVAGVHPEDHEILLEAIHLKLTTGEFDVEYRIVRDDDQVRWIHDRAFPIRDRNGRLVRVTGVANDITERKQLETQLHQAQKLESVGHLAAGIAHEINTPTQYVGDNTRFLQDAFQDLIKVEAKQLELLRLCRAGGATAELVTEIEALVQATDIEYLTGEIPHAIQQSLEGIARITKIVQSLKDFAHPGTQEMQAVDLNRAIESTVTVARSEWKYVAELVTDFDPNLPLVPCLLGEFNQVILNIIINAAHAIADVVGDGAQGKGIITVSTRQTEGWAETRISDTGAGIPEKIGSRVFDQFFTTKTVGKGTGQGLSIARRAIVELHGGTLRFDSVEGRGTTFIIRLPLKELTIISERGLAPKTLSVSG